MPLSYSFSDPSKLGERRAVSKNKADQIFARIAKGIYRKTPAKVRRSVKNAITQSLPASSAPRAREFVPNKSKAKQSKIHMSPADVGSTYDENVVLPMLALENNALHNLLRQTQSKLETSRRRLAEANESLDPPAVTERRDRAARLAEEYIAGQQNNAPIRHLVLANEYPRQGREYGNGFVHQRVKRYLEAGVAVDIVCAGYSVEQDLYEYDGVRVLTGHGEEISEILSRQVYTSVSVHFLNRRIWDALEPYLEKLDVHVFLHGYESSRWVRQLSNYRTGRDLERAIDRSITLQQFWHEVVHHPYQPESYIFVSDWWRRAVYDDTRLTFPSNRVHIIHNYINTELFEYIPKADEQRFNILWVRSASNRKYGNDIAIRVIEQLARSSYWDRCKITIIGDGHYFPEFERRLGKFDNVHIEQRFVSQEEIAALHKTHGIFLVPSRLDSQGVSRDEAMSSGLVPATNLVTAIPEFVDSESGIVAEAENAGQLAAGIVELWGDPDKFQRLSRTAAQRVRKQSGREATIGRELKTLGIEG